MTASNNPNPSPNGRPGVRAAVAYEHGDVFVILHDPLANQTIRMPMVEALGIMGLVQQGIAAALHDLQRQALAGGPRIVVPR